MIVYIRANRPAPIGPSDHLHMQIMIIRDCVSLATHSGSDGRNSIIEINEVRTLKPAAIRLVWN